MKEKELARINDKVITLQEFEQKMGQLPQRRKQQMIFEEGRRDFLQELINQELLFQEARKKKLDKDKKVLTDLERIKKELVINALKEKLCEGKDDVTEEEVVSYYQGNKKEFILEMVQVRHIVVKTLSEAQEIKRRLDRGEDFITLARQYSISPDAKKGGDLGYIVRGMVGKEFEQAAFALKRRGELSYIVKTESGYYHIIRLEDKIGPRQLALSEVREEIRNYLINKKREEILAAHLQDLREGAQITIHEELLATEKEDST